MIVLTCWQMVDTTPPRQTDYGTLLFVAVIALIVLYGFYRLGKSRAKRAYANAVFPTTSKPAATPLERNDPSTPHPPEKRPPYEVERPSQNASVEVFISYASADRPRAQALAAALSRSGLSTWWDRTIPPGKSFDEIIEGALAGAKCVVVVWTKTSVSSDWVKVEAAEAAKRRIMIPALLEETTIPLEFRRLQAADLIAWDGSDEHPGFRSLLGSITALPGVTQNLK